jgi:hypothetical protein
MLGKTSVRMRSSVENIDAGDYSIDSVSEGQTVELPRWVAEELLILNLAEAREEPFESEIFKALSREKMMGPLQLSVVPEDFYMKMQRRMEYLRQAVAEGRARREDLEKLRTVCYDLVGMRLSKLLSLSSSSTKASDLAEKLTPEERVFFSESQSISAEWKSALLGESK